MPEQPEIEGYVAGLEAHVRGRRLDGIRLVSPFLLRTVEPAPDEAIGLELTGASRVGKRVVLRFGQDLFFVVHPMVAGRLRWKKPGAGLPGKSGLLALDFEGGSLTLTEAGSKKRASLRVVRGGAAVRELDPGGLVPADIDEEAFRERLVSGGHTLKRALTTPKLFSGIGNAWSDEILFRARLSPVTRAGSLDAEEVSRLFAAVREVLAEATARHVGRARESFPDKVTAFQPEMDVHGRYGEPCRVCEAPIQRITRSSGHDFHYCARCQTGGRILADRALSRLLKDDFPKRIEELLD
ncbi:MAG: DNA-formamidopyrimidine glycosylase family protein [Planctomycetota bacterium]